VEYTIAFLIVVTLLSLAGYFGWRQYQALRDLPSEESMSDEDRRYFRRQAWRRLVGCALMVILAGLLSAWYLLGPNEQALILIEQAQKQPATPEQQRILGQGLLYLSAAFLVLLALVLVAGLDFLAIRSYGLRHYRRIQSDRRDMIQRQLIRLRGERNGHT